jgi:hypothetical protein
MQVEELSGNHKDILAELPTSVIDRQQGAFSPYIRHDITPTRQHGTGSPPAAKRADVSKHTKSFTPPDCSKPSDLAPPTPAAASFPPQQSLLELLISGKLLAEGTTRAGAVQSSSRTPPQKGPEIEEECVVDTVPIKIESR